MPSRAGPGGQRGQRPPLLRFERSAGPAPPCARFRTGTQGQAVGKVRHGGPDWLCPPTQTFPPWHGPGTAPGLPVQGCCGLGQGPPAPLAVPWGNALGNAGGLAVSNTRGGRRWLKQSFVACPIRCLKCTLRSFRTAASCKQVTACFTLKLKFFASLVVAVVKS